MPITDHQTFSSIPAEGWVSTYVRHGYMQSAAPAVYHLGTALTMLGTTCPPSYGLRFGPIYIRANMYTLLVGRSGDDNKSTALSTGTRILNQVAKELIGAYPGSAEGLIESLQDQPRQVIPISELGTLLSAATSGYFEKIKPVLTDAWDCGPIQRRKVNHKLVRVDEPRLSLLGACSIPYLEKYTLLEDWTGGFMGRWSVMYGKRDRIIPFPQGNDKHVAWLQAELTRMFTTTQVGPCHGLDPKASTLWTSWYHNLESRATPSRIAGIKSRAPTMALKAAMIYAWDFGHSRTGSPWFITEEILTFGIMFAELHVESVIGLSFMLAEHPDARQRRAVLQALQEEGGVATLGSILKRLKMKKRPVTETLDALLEEGTVSKLQTDLQATSPTFVLQNPDAV